jgi:hypothetical protein
MEGTEPLVKSIRHNIKQFSKKTQKTLIQVNEEHGKDKVLGEVS